MAWDVAVRTWDGLKGRLALSAGVDMLPGSLRVGPQLYAAECYLPREPWRDCDDAAAVLARDDARAIVDVRRVPSDCIAQLRAVCPPDRRLSPSAMKEAPFTQLLASFAPDWRIEGDPAPLGYATYPAGFTTVTFDAANGRFIGLHIDEIDRLPMNSRDSARMRICVNLGEQARHFLFIPITVAGMAERLGCPLAKLESQPSTAFIRQFMRTFPYEPVLRLAVRPGEAYLAPTENLIHDASTAWMTALDFSVTILADLRR